MAHTARSVRSSARITVGKTELQISRLGLGTAPLGGLFERVPEEDAHAAIKQAVDAGVSFFDTAPLYGYGLSESRLGAVLSGLPRDRFVVATKVGRLLRPAPHGE